MATYLISTVESLMTAALILGLLDAFMQTKFGAVGKKVYWISCLFGAVMAVVMAFVKNTSRKFSTGIWNSCIFGVSLIALILYLVVLLLARKGKIKLSSRNLFWLQLIPLGVIGGILVLYSLPDVIASPYTMLLTEDFLSTDFLYRVIGWVFGIVIAIVAWNATRASAVRLDKWMQHLLLLIVLCLDALRQTISIVSVLRSWRIIPSSHLLFTITKFFSNHSDFFLYLTMGTMLVAAIVLWIRSFNVNEPYRNPAEHRKIRAKWRSIRRNTATVLICCVVSILTLTVVASLNNTVVELSPIEDYSYEEDGEVYISYELVEDGHLHRFAYTSENGVEIRFIIVQKPNSSSYGVGMDACEICGETGYYEKDDQIVCKLCDVVMNKNTIGFAGGCNPLIVDYRVENAYIIVSIESLLQYESEFK